MNSNKLIKHLFLKSLSINSSIEYNSSQHGLPDKTCNTLIRITLHSKVVSQHFKHSDQKFAFQRQLLQKLQ